MPLFVLKAHHLHHTTRDFRRGPQLSELQKPGMTRFRLLLLLLIRQEGPVLAASRSENHLQLFSAFVDHHINDLLWHLWSIMGRAAVHYSHLLTGGYTYPRICDSCILPEQCVNIAAQRLHRDELIQLVIIHCPW